LLILILNLTSCALQPLERNESAVPVLPAQWLNAASLPLADVASDWWRAFGSGALDRLIALAEAESLDVAVAVARVRQADAAARIAGAPLLPDVSARLDAGRQGDFDGASIKSYGTALSAQFELDFWGKNRAHRDAALATLAASTFDRDTVRLTVTAGVANAWLQAVALRERIGLAELNLKSAERLLELVASRLRAGAASPLELAQQRGLTAGQRRTVALLRQQADAARTALETLLAFPGGIEIGEETLDSLTVPVLGAGIPSTWLTRCPDVARAEALLAAADADLLAARAALLPSFNLGAEISATAGSLRRVFDHPAYSLLAGLAAPIFDAGRLAAARDLSAAEREERLANYRRTILDAFSDVELALNEARSLETQALLHAEELVQAQRAFTLAEARYRAGAETLLTLLDAQRVFYAARDEALQLRLARLHAAVSLYKAGGGGWRAETKDQNPGEPPS
jgi:NodT family efflux transporter outer membrane factor (OMF) lipoprotein